MSVLGIAAGPDQIADGTDPSVLATVDSDGNLQEVSKGIDQAGQTRTSRLGPGGEQEIGSQAVLLAILVELRTITSLLTAIGSGQVVMDDPDQYREDADKIQLAS